MAKGLFITNDEGMPVLWAGVSDNGDGLLTVSSKTGQNLIAAGSSTDFKRRGRVKTLRPGP